jgi:hypothetical protein
LAVRVLAYHWKDDLAFEFSFRAPCWHDGKYLVIPDNNFPTAARGRH